MKKIFIVIVVFLVSLKVVDIIFVKFIGLGSPLIYRHSKIYGYDLKPNQKILRRGKSVTINDFGMRSLKNWSNQYEKKLLFFGDSVTFGGSLVNDEDTFVEKICKRIKNIKTICGNYSVNGYGIEAISKRIKYKNFFDEDLIIITVIGNDFLRGFANLGVQPFTTKKYPAIFPALIELFFLSTDNIRNKIKYNFNNISENKQTLERYQNDQLNYFLETLEELNKEYFVFYSPEYSEFKGNNEYENIKTILSENIKNFFDLTSEIKKHEEKIYYDGVHLNKLGHKLYSDIIFKKIKGSL